MSYIVITAADGAVTSFPSTAFDEAFTYFTAEAGPDARIDFAVSESYYRRFYATQEA